MPKYNKQTNKQKSIKYDQTAKHTGPYDARIKKKV